MNSKTRHLLLGAITLQLWDWFGDNYQNKEGLWFVLALMLTAICLACILKDSPIER